MSTTIPSIFEYATRTKIRFPSVRGGLTTEQLWDVPLRSNDGFDLNEVAKGINKSLKTASEEDFVEASSRKPEQVRLEATLEVVTHVIRVKLDEEAAARKRADNKREKEALLAILAEKQENKLSALSEAELKRRIAALE